MKRLPSKALATGAAVVVLLALSVLIPPARQGLLALPWELSVFACLTLGLAPFAPPHLVEKLKMLAADTLVKPIDWFDMAMHATPWLVLVAKVLAVAVDA